MPRPRAQSPTYSLAERDGRYYVQWWEGDRKKRRSLGTGDRETAKRELRAFLAQIDVPPAPEQPTVAEILQGYLADRSLRVASVPTLTHACAALTEHLGPLRPESLNRSVARRYATLRRNQGRRNATGTKAKGVKVGAPVKALSDGTIIRELVTLRAALRWAEGERWITSVPYIEVPQAPRPRDRWLSRGEALTLLEAAVAPHVRLFIALGLYTGARSGAILELTWQQVDFGAGLIHMGAGAGNKQRAIVPISFPLRRELEKAAQSRTTDWVVEYRGDRVHLIRHGFRNAVAEAKLARVTPHTLRHTAATWMVQAGISFEMVAKFLGNTAKMVEKVYGHHSPDYLRQAADALGGAPSRVPPSPVSG
ncbi:tyrosine-type recombinase/integrase [Rhizosaccharibacter radicis]|uniref:Site-specific integrase n=1 Tax=Rhizosaccharibacter radicis TaxID=2782605 RepID=A0ABT1VW58_9PROT|nr:site-specific integrase [Acetobacteraceae bacterium KSS12]